MTYGINIRNRIGFLQLDGNYHNYFLKEEGFAAACSNGDGNEDSYNFANTYSYNRAPLVAIRPLSTSYGIAVTRFKVTSGKISGFYALTEYNHNCTFDWRLYCVDYGAPPEYGIQIFNERGNQIFCSSENNLKITYGGGSRLVVIPDDLGITTPTYAPVDHPDYENPFYILQPCSFMAQYSGGPGTYWGYRGRAGITKVDSTSAKVEWIVKISGTYSRFVLFISASTMFCGVVPE